MNHSSDIDPLDTPDIMELMFPATQTAPLHTGAVGASLADIVREQTQDGRLIVNFLAQAMLGELTDFKPHHRLQASDRLVKLESSPEFTGMVREHTRGGDLISQFLIRAVMGQLPDFRPCHRMEAMWQLAIINPKMARALTEDNTPHRSRPLRTGAVGAPSPSTGEGRGEGEGAVGAAAQQLADIIRQETNDGRDIARFFIDVMQGTRIGFDQRFRFAAAEVLIHRGYDYVAVGCPDPAAHAHAPTPAPNHDTDANEPDPAPETAWRWKPEWTHFEYPEDNTYDFSIYGEEEYDRDVYGDKALVHIFGDDETKSASNLAVLDYQVDRIEAQRAAGHSDLDTYQPAPDPPDDDSFGRHTYGHNALLYIYGSKAAARVGYTTAMAHKKRRDFLAAADVHDTVDHDLGNGPDPPDPPPEPRKPRVLAYF